MLENVKGVPPSTSLLIVVLSNIVGACGYLFHGWLGDKIGRKNVIILGWAMAAVMWTLFILGPSNFGYVLITYMGSLFFLLGPYAAILFYQGECYSSTCRATGSSFVNSIGQPGTIAASALLTGMVAGSMPLGDAALIVGTGGMAVSAIVMVFARRVAVLEH
jgi:predicted MFS family arabinose efflux permease